MLGHGTRSPPEAAYLHVHWPAWLHTVAPSSLPHPCALLQKFGPAVLPKVAALRSRFPRINIIVDGGITLEASDCQMAAGFYVPSFAFPSTTLALYASCRYVASHVPASSPALLITANPHSNRAAAPLDLIPPAHRRMRRWWRRRAPTRWWRAPPCLRARSRQRCAARLLPVMDDHQHITGRAGEARPSQTCADATVNGARCLPTQTITT